MEKGSYFIVFIICFSIIAPLISAEDPDYIVTAETNRPSYEPGYTVELSGTLHYRDTMPASYEYVGVEIKPSEGYTDYFQLLTDEYGIFGLSYQLNETSPYGNYSVTIAKGYERVTCSFDVVIEAPNLAPYTPSQPFPSNGSTGISNSVVLSWNGGDPDPFDIVNYSIYFGESTLLLLSEDQTDTILSVSNLGYGKTYSWKIVSNDQMGHSIEGPLWVFTTLSTGNNIPVIPSSIIGDAQGYHGSCYVYTVSTIDYDDDDLYYQFNWDDGPYSTWLGPMPSGIPLSCNHTWNIPGTYNITVRVKDVHDAISDWSTPLSITIENRPPLTPTYPIPPNGSTDRLLSSVLRFIGGDPDTGDTVLYDIYFGTSHTLDLIVSRQLDISFTPSLQYDTLYYWQVVSWDSYNVSSTGPLWSFQTQSAPSSGGSGEDGGNVPDDVIDNETIPREPPIASFSYTPSIGHSSERIMFDASESHSDGYIVEWSWDFGDGNRGSGEIISHSYMTPATYTVTLTVEDDSGNQSRSSKHIIILPLIQYRIDITLDNDTLIGDDLTVDVVIVNDGDDVSMNLSILSSLSYGSSEFWSAVDQVSFSEVIRFTKTIDTTGFPEGSYIFSVNVLYDDVCITEDSTIVLLRSDALVFEGVGWYGIIIGVIISIIIIITIIYYNKIK